MCRVVQYLLKVDEEMHGTSKLLFHRNGSINAIHASVAGCKNANGMLMVRFLVDYALKNKGNGLLEEVITSKGGSVIDVAYYFFALHFGEKLEEGNEFWYRIQVLSYLNARPCTACPSLYKGTGHSFLEIFGDRGLCNETLRIYEETKQNWVWKD